MTAPKDLPAAPLPPEVDLLGLHWMPLEVHKVMTSTLFVKSTGDEFKAAFALWCASWYETPAASLPDDDVMLANFSKAGKKWPKVKARALSGWKLHDDGRLYHDTVVRNAIVAWERRVEHREVNESKSERQKRWRARCKQLGEELRALGVTPPKGAKLETLETLLVDAKASTKGNVKTPTGDGVSIAKTGTGQGEGQGVKEKASPDGAAPDEKPMTATDLIRLGVEPKVARDWLKIRKIKKAPLTETAWEGVVREAKAAGLIPAAAVKVSAENNWQGFKASWYKRLIDEAAAGSPPAANAAANDEAKRLLGIEAH